MDKRIDKSIKQFIEEVEKQTSKLLKVYLFGSYANNKETSDSDIDIALILIDIEDSERFDIQVRMMMLASKFDLRIEPHIFSIRDFNLGNPFVHEVKKTGVEIYSKDSEFVE